MEYLVAEVVLSIAVILLSCEIFANAVEHIGDHLGWSHAAAGSLLAAVGTALPETLIPVIALISGGEHGEHIGIGAILGAPFMLSTLAFFLLSITVIILKLTGRRKDLTLFASYNAMKYELKYFIFVMSLVLVISIIRYKILNYIMAAGFILVYIKYCAVTFRHPPEENEEYTDFCYFNKFFKLGSSVYCHIFQVFAGLVGIIIGAKIFVGGISQLSIKLGISSLVLSLLIAPIATELPEKYNSITWTIRRKDTLALANITGAMVFQSTFPVSIGLIFTTWTLGNTELLNISFALTMAIIVLTGMTVKKRLSAAFLMPGGFFYAFYIIRIFFW